MANKFCSNCGEPVTDPDANNCINCGKPLRMAQTESASNKKYTADNQSQSQKSNFPRAQSKNKGLRNVIIIAVLVILVLGALNASGFFESKYTVTYAPGTHGTFSPQVTNNLTNGSRTPTAPTATGQTGYIFSGWSPTVQSTVTRNITYTAQWIETYTVTYAPGTHGTFFTQTTGNLTSGSRTPTAPTVTGQTGYIFSGWSPTVQSTVTKNITYTAQWIKEPPNATITSHNIRSDISGFHYYTYVDVSVHNYGGSGTVIVWATVTQDGREWTKSQSLYLNARESQNLKFTFIEPSLWGSTIRSQVWVENVK